MWCCFFYSFRQYWLVHYFVKLFFVVFKNIVKKRFLFFRVMRDCSVLDYVAIHIRGKAMWKLCANTAKWRKWSKTLSHMKSSRDLSAVKVCETSLLDYQWFFVEPPHMTCGKRIVYHGQKLRAGYLDYLFVWGYELVNCGNILWQCGKELLNCGYKWKLNGKELVNHE